jgi:hypothetical protein
VEARLHELERRLARAERQVRVLRGGALLALMGMMALAATRTATTQGEGSTVRAPFSVVDARGSRLVSIEAEMGAPVLRLHHPAGRAVATLRVDGDAARFDLLGPDERSRVWMGIDTQGGFVHLHNGAGQHVATFGSDADGGILAIRDRASRPAAAIAVDSDGGILVVRDRAGKRVGWFGTDARGGNFALYDRAGKIAFTRPEPSPSPKTVSPAAKPKPAAPAKPKPAAKPARQ